MRVGQTIGPRRRLDRDRQARLVDVDGGRPVGVGDANGDDGDAEIGSLVDVLPQALDVGFGDTRDERETGRG